MYFVHFISLPRNYYVCQGSVFSSVLSHLNKYLKQQTLEPLVSHSSRIDRVIALRSWTDRVIPLRSRTDCVIALRSVLQLYVTALFYLENSRKIHPQGVRACQPKDTNKRKWGSVRAQGEREKPGPLAPLFICFFLPPGQPYVNWTSQECCLYYLRSSLLSSDLPLFYFHGLFPSLSFSHCHFGLLFPILTTNGSNNQLYSLYKTWVNFVI